MADVVAIRARQQADLVRESNAILEDEVQLLPVPDPPKTRWQAIHRSAAFQIMMVSVLAFSGPGMSEAITALGGGGLAAPWAASRSSPLYLLQFEHLSSMSNVLIVQTLLRVSPTSWSPLSLPSADRSVPDSVFDGCSSLELRPSLSTDRPTMSVMSTESIGTSFWEELYTAWVSLSGCA